MQKSKISFIAALLGGWLMVLAPARAFHTPETPSLEDTAYLLQHREVLLGPLIVGVGFYRLQLSTRPGPWILGAAFGKFIPNVRLDALVVSRRAFSLSIGSGLFYVNSRKIMAAEPVVHMYMVPFTGAFSARLTDDHTFSLRGTYLAVFQDVDTEQKDLEIESGVIAENAQLQASWMWRLTRVTALVTSLRYLAYQADPIVISDVTVDARTDVRVESEIKTKKNAVAGSISAVMSWEHLNLRAGLGYGALFMPGTNLVLPLKWPYPEFNIYWRL